MPDETYPDAPVREMTVAQFRLILLRGAHTLASGRSIKVDGADCYARIVFVDDAEARAMELFDNGPDRVLVNREGEAHSPERAREMKREADVIFIRRDGWTLGAPVGLEGVAYRLWKDQWTAFARRPFPLSRVTPIAEYLE